MKCATILSITVLAASCLGSVTSAQSRVPGERWMRYADPADAGWSTDKLAQAKEYWESIGSAAWMVVENGVVVAAWGDCERRYMCHSVRKSFLSGLYGIHVESGDIEVQRTLADLGIDDEPKLTETEKGASILDLLCARSGVYKLAAYEPPLNPKPDRGTHAPGTNWCYNNFDFNTLCTIFEQETGLSLFEEFEAGFAQPLGMQDFRVSDGYYHYELDKSIHPAYPFRMSARDCARYGLLYLNKGLWGDERILSEQWVQESTRSISDAGVGQGYGYMWWTFDDPSNGISGYTALGVGGQQIAVLPSNGLVIINRTDTYMRRNVSSDDRNRLMGMIVDAKTGESADAPELIALSSNDVPRIALASDQLQRFVGAYDLDGEVVQVIASNGALALDLPSSGVFHLAPVQGAERTFWIEDIELHVAFASLAGEGRGELLSEYSLCREFRNRSQAGAFEAALAIAERALEQFPMSAMAYVMIGRAMAATGDAALAQGFAEAALEIDAEHQEAHALAKTLMR